MALYQAYSPDGFTIERGKSFYRKPETAQRAIDKFVKRFVHQGYYSKSNRERIPLWELEQQCTIKEL